MPRAAERSGSRKRLLADEAQCRRQGHRAAEGDFLQRQAEDHREAKLILHAGDGRRLGKPARRCMQQPPEQPTAGRENMEKPEGEGGMRRASSGRVTCPINPLRFRARAARIRAVATTARMVEARPVQSDSATALQGPLGQQKRPAAGANPRGRERRAQRRRKPGKDQQTESAVQGKAQNHARPCFQPAA